MEKLKLEDFDFDGTISKYYLDFSRTKEINMTEASTCRHYRFHQSGDKTKLVEVDDNGSEKLVILSKCFPNEQPSKVQIWLQQGEFEFRREYYDEVVKDFDASGKKIRVMSIF